MAENIFVMKNRVTWSLLNDGFNIKSEERGLFAFYMKDALTHGSSHDIRIKIEGEEYHAQLKNINFDRERWKGHKDIIQIRYSAKSPIAQKLRTIFASAYQYLYDEKMKQSNPRCHIDLPSYLNEYFVLTASTTESYVFEMDCFTVNDVQHLSKTMPYISEEEFESSEDDQLISERIAKMTDNTAAIEECSRIVKIRKVDRTIIDNLKHIYDYRCQISGDKIGEKYGLPVIEAHHIDYFTHSQNNDAQNIIVLSPNYHRIIHRNNPHFNSQTKCFEFENGQKLGLKLNLHL